MDEFINSINEVPEHMRDMPVNLTYRKLAMILEIIFNRDVVAYDRLARLESQVNS